MNKKILIVVDKYLPYPSSNGACIANLVNSFSENNDDVTILTIYGHNAQENINGVNIYSMQVEKTNVKLFDKVFGFLEDKALVKKIVLKIYELYQQYEFDIVVGVYRPIESIIAVNRISNLLNIKACYLFCDIPITSSMNRFKSSIIQKNYIRLYKKLINSGKVIAFKYYKKYFVDCLNRALEQRIIYIGTPNFIPVHTVPLSCGETVDLVYTGSFYDNTRNPQKMLEVLKVIIGTNIVLHLYSWGCEDIINEYKKLYGKNLVIHGRVSSNKIKEVLANANIFVNLSNISEYQVPGKVMEYFSYGKPVINFKFIENDPGDKDYKSYPLIYSVELFESCNFGFDQIELINFIKVNRNNQVKYSTLSKLYNDSTPNYLLAKIIEG